MPKIKPGSKHWKTRDTLTKVLILLKFLSEHRFGATIEELMDEVEVSRRALYRYFEVLDQVGIKLTGGCGPGMGKARYRLADRVTWARTLGVM